MKLALALITATLLAAPTANAKNWRHRQVDHDATKRVLLIGDSITVGQGASNRNRTSYAAILRNKLPSLEIVNAGCGGATSADIVRQTPGPAWACSMHGTLWPSKIAPELPADVVIIAVGSNDVWGAWEDALIEPEVYEENLRTTIGMLDGGPVILLTPPKWKGARSSVVLDERLRAYREAIYRIASDTLWVEVVDVYALLEPEDFEWIWWRAWGRGVHPNDSGHAKIAAALNRVISALFSKR